MYGSRDQNKWNDQHCQNVLVFEQILQSSTIRNNGLIEKCFVGYFLALVSGTFFYHPLQDHFSLPSASGKNCDNGKSTETDICSLCTLAVHYGCKIENSLFHYFQTFSFFLYYVIVQICPSREKGFITINYYIQELNNILL